MAKSNDETRALWRDSEKAQGMVKVQPTVYPEDRDFILAIAGILRGARKAGSTKPADEIIRAHFGSAQTQVQTPPEPARPSGAQVTASQNEAARHKLFGGKG